MCCSAAGGSATTIGVEPVTPSTVALMVATPLASMVTTPFELTAATLGLLLL